MYGFEVTVTGDFDDVVTRTTEALKAQGFGVLTDIDVAATLKKKLGIEKAPYRILGACNPGYANQALEADPDIGLLLPCNVVVRENSDGRVDVLFMDPAIVMAVASKPGLETLAAEVRDLLHKVRDALAAQ